MAYSAMTNLAAGALVTEAEWDKIKGNFDFLAQPPSVRVRRSGVQSISNVTETVVTWDLEDWDTDTMHSTVSNTSRLTATTAGKYRVWVTIKWAANSTGNDRMARLYKNGTVQEEGTDWHPPAGDGNSNNFACELELAATDYVEVKVYQDSGGSLDVAVQSRFGMTWVGL